ncbi:MAG: response regulator transcription factor [Lachnospiraceae bacterium]|nr:response regulator transcription factor [Lachnospiraceae bacterium]
MIDIYYVEEDKRIAQAVKKFLTQAGYHVCVFPTIDQIKEALKRMRPALVLVDWNMPDGTGILLCQWIRQNGYGLPVLFIAARSPIHSLISEPEDYVVKPFELDVLLVRIRALLRKRCGAVKQQLSCDVIKLDRSRMQVCCGAEEVHLSPSEYRLLLHLMQNKGRTVTRETLLSAIWDTNGTDVSNNTLSVTVKRLRAKLHQPECLKTVHSVGYRMEDSEKIV